MGFVKETNSARWDMASTTTWDGTTLSWVEEWTKEQFVDPNAYTYYSTVWNSVTGKWNELT